MPVIPKYSWRCPSSRDSSSKTMDPLQKIFLAREGRTFPLRRAQEYLGIAGIYYFDLTAFLTHNS